MRLKLMTLCMALCCLCFNALAQNVPDYVSTEGLVAWWPMNGNVDDAIGFLHGFNQGGIETEGPYGQIGQALELPSGDDYIDLPTGGVNEEGGLTLAFWAWLELPSEGAAPLIDRVEVSNNLWSFSYEQSSETVHFITRNNDGSGYHNLSTWSPPAAEWVHVTSVYRAPSGLKELHVNGTLVGEELAPLDGFTMPTMRLGEVAEGTWNSNCRFSKVGVWERALVEEEILALYNAQLPVLGCTESTACNFNEEANIEDDSCVYPLFGEDCETGGAACGEGTIWDSSLQSCVGFDECPSDLNDDGIVGINDLLSLLSDFGMECPPGMAEWTCGDLMNYHGYDYATVQIGEQCWFAENLRSSNFLNGENIPLNSIENPVEGTNPIYKAAYDDDSLSVEENGFLYSWYATDDSRGVCPLGWHVPAVEEFQTLFEAVGGISIAAFQLKAQPPIWNGDDSFGYTALPSGYLALSDDQVADDYYYLGSHAYFWTNTSTGPVSAYYVLLRPENMNAQLYPSNGNLAEDAMSVRCLKDTE